MYLRRYFFYRFNRFTTAEAGTYTCTAENPLGIVLASRQLVLRGVPLLRVVQRSPYVVRTGDPIRLDCIAFSNGIDGGSSSSQPTSISGQILRWSKQGQAITSYSTQDVHGSTRSLIIRRVAPSDAGHYVCSCCTPAAAVNHSQPRSGETEDGGEPREKTVAQERVLVIGTPGHLQVAQTRPPIL